MIAQPIRETVSLIRQRIPNASLAGLLKIFPATILIVALVVTIQLATNGHTAAEQLPLLDRFGFDWDYLVGGRWWNLFTGTLVQSKPGYHYSMVLVVVSAVGILELVAGSRWTLAVFFVGDWVSSFLGIILLRILSGVGFAEATPLLSFPDAGTSGAAHVCYAVAATLFPRRMAFFLYGLILGVTIILLFSQQLSAAVTHLCAILSGGAFGWFYLRPRIYGEETSEDASEHEIENVLQ
ncbi:MAG: hypothetical protein ACR2OU_03010 [Thermomicrobiales bacterium]